MDVGDTSTVTAQVDPHDGTTAAALTLHAPDGTTSTPATSTANGGATWTATGTWSQPGWWLLVWTITGTGAGVVQQRQYVEPVATAVLPTWAPDLARVADLIPTRTLVGVAGGYGDVRATFDAATHPTGDQVTRLVAEACAWVQLRTGPVADSLTESARSAAALWTAGMVELTYPDRNQDITVAQTLLGRADKARDDLARANEAATGDDPTFPAVSFVWGFPQPEPYGDYNL